MKRHKLSSFLGTLVHILLYILLYIIKPSCPNPDRVLEPLLLSLGESIRQLHEART